jgi:DNA-binding transcriptional LysR family regulator
LNIRFLETFLWLARLKSFGATAERLNTTQPAISARLRTLEQELGIELIFRTSREVHVTPEGLGILRHVEAIIDLAHLIENDVTRDGEPAGIVRVGVVDAILRTWLPRPLEALRARHTKLSVEVMVDTTVQLAKSLREGDLHMVVAIEPIRDLHLSSIELCNYAMTWVASPRLVDPARLYSLHDLAQLPLIGYLRQSPPDHLIAEYFEGVDLSRARISASNSMSSMIRLVSDGLGVAAVPPICVKREIEAGEICVVQAERAFKPVSFVASFRSVPQSLAITTVLQAFQGAASAFAKEAAGDLAWAP